MECRTLTTVDISEGTAMDVLDLEGIDDDLEPMETGTLQTFLVE